MFLSFYFLFFPSSFHAGLRPGDLTEPDRQHSHCAAETCPEQRSTCEVGFRDKVRITFSFFRPEGASIDRRKKNLNQRACVYRYPTVKARCQGIQHLAACVSFSELYLFCWFWSCVEEAVEPLKMRSQNPLQPWLAPGFLFFTRLFMCRAAHHEHRRLLGDWGIVFPAWLAIYEGRAVFCLSAKLLGKDYRFASPDATVGFWQPTRSFSAAICEVGCLHPNSCGRGISRWSQFLLSEWPPLLSHPQIATGHIITQRARENWISLNKKKTHRPTSRYEHLPNQPFIPLMQKKQKKT